MADDGVKYDGVQYLKRTEGDQAKRIDQELGIEIDRGQVSVQFTGLQSGRHRPVVSEDPAVIEHYRKLDRAQFIASIADRDPLPEPIRVPVGRVPDGMCLCPRCAGGGLMEDPDDGLLINCRRCGGDGIVASFS